MCVCKKTIAHEVRAISMLIRHRMDTRCSGVQELNRLTGMHGWVIGYLYHHEGDVYQRDLEARFDFKRSTATKLLQLLEKKGLITREEAEGDRRLKRIILTDTAIEMSKKLESELGNADSEIDALLTSSELETFLTLCEKLRSGLEPERNKAYD